MLPWLENLTSPEKLVLAWEPPTHFPDRMKWSVGELSKSETDTLAFRYFNETELQNLNDGKTSTDLIKAGFAGYPAFKSLQGRAWSGTEVLSAFLRRLPSPSRPDYSKFLELFRVRSSLKPSALQLLSITEARSPNDGFALIDTLDDAPSECDCLLEVVGCRHYEPDLNRDLIGSSAELRAELDNTHDPNAVEVFVASQKIGYINRLQAPAVKKWLSEKMVQSVLVRINGTKDRPRPYILVQVREANRLRAA